METKNELSQSILKISDSSFFSQAQDTNNLSALDSYLNALGVPVEIHPDHLAENLRTLAIHHFQKYAFHSLYFNLKDKNTSEAIPIVLERDALIHQLIQDHGGSCYHHNAVFQAILEHHGIESWFVSCLVRDPMNPEKAFKLATHIAIVLKYQEILYLFDPGWDGTSFSIYPLPSTTDTPTQQGTHQVRKVENEGDFPFIFEEIIQSDDSNAPRVVPRYDFNSQPIPLNSHNKAIQYLNSEEYPFHTLFLFTRITPDQHSIRFINRRLIIQDIAGNKKHTEELPDEVSPMQKIVELLGPQEGLMKSLTINDFKNPELGLKICEMPGPSLRIGMP